MLLCVGDSITQFSKPTFRLGSADPSTTSQDGLLPAAPGWGDRLAGYFDRRVDVCNRGFSGYNTNGAFNILNDIDQKASCIDLVVIWFGANDAADPELNPFNQHVPISEFESNLSLIISSFKTPNIVLVTPPPIHPAKYKEFRRGMRIPGRNCMTELPRELSNTHKPFCELLSDIRFGLLTCSKPFPNRMFLNRICKTGFI